MTQETGHNKVSVVILNWNGAEMMRRFLPNVIEATGNDGKVIVADNGSTDNSLEMLEKEFPQVGIIALPRNFGFAEGYNQALAQVDSEYFVLLNSDVACAPNWLRPMVEYMDAHPEIAACQPKLLSERQRNMFEYAGAAGGFIDRYGYPFCRGRIFTDVEEDNGQYDGEVTPIFWASGAAMLVRSKDWRDNGGLDGNFFAHCEEIDFCWRLRRSGRGIVYIPQSTVYHVGGGTLAQGNPRKTFLNFRNNLLMLYKNLPDSQLKKVMRVRAFLDYIAAFKFLIGRSLGEAQAVVRARREFRRMLPQYRSWRKEHLPAENANIPEIMPSLLLTQYYLHGRKRFPQLKF